MSYLIKHAETGEVLIKGLSYTDTEDFRRLHPEDMEKCIIEDEPEGDE